jgi:hypothetical protein
VVKLGLGLDCWTADVGANISRSSAACCNEAFKIATTCAPYLNNYMMVRISFI